MVFLVGLWGVIIPWYPRVMPGAHTCLCVEEVDLTLHRGPLLCLDKQKDTGDDCGDALRSAARGACWTNRIPLAGQVADGREVGSEGCGHELWNPAL